MTSNDLFRHGVLPLALIKDEALERNISSYAAYCRERALDLAPHVKTTMSPEIFRRQRQAGAWAATVATAQQAINVLCWGVDRVLVASQIVDPVGLRWLIEAGDSKPGTELFSWVDSLAGLRTTEERFRSVGGRTPVRLLLEVGHNGGRTGCRDPNDALAVAQAVAESDVAQLCGIAAFEGTIPGGRAATVEVDLMLRKVRSIFLEVQRRGWFAQRRAIVTVGGSVHFDRVAARLADLAGDRARVVLRSGCYVTHDCGIYDENSPLGSRGENVLAPALEVWGAVLSCPEQGLAIANLGRRDVSFDAGLPKVINVKRRSRAQLEDIELDSWLEVVALNDQHAFISDPVGVLQVGDVVGTGISHPCTTFDKWRRLALVDGHYRQIGTITTEFP